MANSPILIIDRGGWLGSELSRSLSKDRHVVLAGGGTNPQIDNVVFDPFRKACRFGILPLFLIKSTFK